MLHIFPIYKCNSAEKVDYKSVINYHLAKHPEMESVDLYKLIYQGAMGPAHLGTTYEEIHSYLIREMKKIQGRDKKMVEKITSDNKYLRINLFAFKKAEGNIDSLAKMVYRSCQKEPKGFEKINKYMETASKIIKSKKTNLDYDDFIKLWQEIKQNNYPVPHHSEQYITKYNPSYRVISQKEYKENFKACFEQGFNR